MLRVAAAAAIVLLFEMLKLVRRIIPKHPLSIFFFMLFSALIFGLSSFNLFFLLQANVGLVYDHGLMALEDGAFQELIRLFGYGVVSLLSYLIFKIGEKKFVDLMTE